MVTIGPFEGKNPVKCQEKKYVQVIKRQLLLHTDF